MSRTLTSFVRFIFFVLVAGIVLNLTIVVLANMNSERQREAELQKERDSFERLLTTVNGRLRRAEIGVEWQTIDASENCLETSLLVRQFYLTENDDHKPMPIMRVKVPGNRIILDGLLLEFDALFARDHQNLQVFRGKRLAYFDHLYVEGQPDEKRFGLLDELRVPELTRINPLLAGDARNAFFPSIHELQIWNRLWEYIQRPAVERPPGLLVTPLVSAPREVRRGEVYWAFIGPDGITLERQTLSGLLSAMRAEADKLPR